MQSCNELNCFARTQASTTMHNAHLPLPNIILMRKQTNVSIFGWLRPLIRTHVAANTRVQFLAFTNCLSSFTATHIHLDGTKTAIERNEWDKLWQPENTNMQSTLPLTHSNRINITGNRNLFTGFVIRHSVGTIFPLF